MTGVFCFTGSGHSLRVAEYIAEKLNSRVCMIDSKKPASAEELQSAVVVFPVYCQNIPQPVKDFLKKLRTENAALIATYGKISCGNVLAEAKGLVRGRVIAGACVPIGHTFLNGSADFDHTALEPLFERIENPREAIIPTKRKSIFADFLPDWRSRLSVKIIRAGSCIGCNVCGRSCPMGAIKNGTTNNKCIRCLRCVASCPQKALSFKNSFVLQKYLSKQREEKAVELYL